MLFRSRVVMKDKIVHFLKADSNISRLSILLFVSVVALAIMEPDIFLTQDYMVSMLYLFPEFGILALGMAFCMISGGIDLCVVATANFSGILACIFMKTVLGDSETPGAGIAVLCIAVLLALLIGMICGALNGVLIAKLGIPPILATLGGSDLVMGLAIALTKGSSVTDIPPALNATGTHIFGDRKSVV